MRPRVLAIALLLFVASAAACDDTAESAAPPEGARGDPAPSRQAASICEEMVRDGVEEIVGEPLVDAPRATRAGATYSCRYRFDAGAVELTVEDMGTPAKARGEITDQLALADVREGLPGLAEGGLWKTNGNLALAKDEYVLTVDVTRTTSDKHAASLRIAEAVLGCW